MSELTPPQIVAELDRDIVGQNEAKRAVAVALRNRWRRRQLPEDLRAQISPKNILMIGPTGVGKTEIARRLAKLVGAPFVKVEATKFTEVGYVGRDVESIVRDLIDAAVTMVKESERRRVQEHAEARAVDRLLDLLLPSPTVAASARGWFDPTATAAKVAASPPTEEEAERRQRTRDKLREKLEAGELDEREVEITLQGRPMPNVSVLGAGTNMENMEMELQSMFEKFVPKTPKNRKMTVREARPILVTQEAEALIEPEKVNQLAITLAEESGIVFLDELDKVAGEDGGRGPDVSRQGVQRDLLPIVEGTIVNTRYGSVRTDHVLFIAAGAFHKSKPSDLMPELQGRFPIRVELADLNREDFARILREPRVSLIKQYEALLKTEGVEVVFDDGAIDALADIAHHVNRTTQNIGARRLHTLLERVLEPLSFDAAGKRGERVVIDSTTVRSRLDSLVQDEDLSRFIL